MSGQSKALSACAGDPRAPGRDEHGHHQPGLGEAQEAGGGGRRDLTGLYLKEPWLGDRLTEKE
jgi:hypothetical protein